MTIMLYVTCQQEPVWPALIVVKTFTLTWTEIQILTYLVTLHHQF